MRKYIFAQESFYLQRLLNDINEQDTSFLDCTHKHMMKCVAPTDKFGVHVSYVYLYSLLASPICYVVNPEMLSTKRFYD